GPGRGGAHLPGQRRAPRDERSERSPDPDDPQRRSCDRAVRGTHHRRAGRRDAGVNIEVLTLFPELFPGPLSSGVTGRGLAAGLVTLQLHNLRDYTHDRHRQVDDIPYGGGAGMVLKPEPIFEAVRARTGTGPVILLSPQGERLTQGLVRELAGGSDFYLICGRYEGVDERVSTHLVDREVSIGDYVLTGGELPAMVVIDAVRDRKST